MDAKDSQKIYEALDHLNADNTALFEDLSEHRTVINSVIRAFNDSTLGINENFRTIKLKLSEIGSNVDKNTQEIVLSEIQTVLLSHAFQLEEKISDIIDITQKAHDGVISGKLFRLPTFSEALARLHRATLQDIRLPFNLENLHLRQLNIIADIEGHYLDNNVVLSISFPLTEKVFDLYKLTSVPIRMKEGIYALLNSPYPYIATVDNGHSDIMLLTKDQIDQCVSLDKENYVCRHSIAMYTDKSRSCIRSLISGKVNFDECSVKGFKTNSELWEPLAADNKWLYVVPKAAQLQITCPKERRMTEVKGVGILYLKPPCRAFTSEVQLTTITKSQELPAVTISLDTKVLDNYNFTGLRDIEIDKKGLGHIDLQHVGSQVPLLPIANSTYQRKHTEERMQDQTQKIRIYEALLLGGTITLIGLVVFCAICKYRLAIWRLLFLRDKSSQTSNDMLEPTVSHNTRGDLTRPAPRREEA